MKGAGTEAPGGARHDPVRRLVPLVRRREHPSLDDSEWKFLCQFLFCIGTRREGPLDRLHATALVIGNSKRREGEGEIGFLCTREEALLRSLSDDGARPVEGRLQVSVDLFGRTVPELSFELIHIQDERAGRRGAVLPTPPAHRPPPRRTSRASAVGCDGRLVRGYHAFTLR